MTKRHGTSSLLRAAEHQALSRVILSGTVLDLGGDKRSEYRSLFKGDYTVTTLNLDDATAPDIKHDLETPLSIASASFDNVLLINVFEHIFNYQQLLAESARVLKPGGKLVMVVPFLFPAHPSPSDYRRFTAEALQGEFECLKFEDIEIIPLGTGVFSACYLFVDRLLPRTVQLVSHYSLRYVVKALDTIAIASANLMKRKYDPAHYALGYCVTARKSMTAGRA